MQKEDRANKKDAALKGTKTHVETLRKVKTMVEQKGRGL